MMVRRAEGWAFCRLETRVERMPSNWAVREGLDRSSRDHTRTRRRLSGDEDGAAQARCDHRARAGAVWRRPLSTRGVDARGWQAG